MIQSKELTDKFHGEKSQFGSKEKSKDNEIFSVLCTVLCVLMCTSDESREKEP